MDILDELERLSKAATPGPWEKRSWASLQTKSTFQHVADCFRHPKDAELIAAMRNNIDQLIEIAKAASYLIKNPGDEVAMDVLKMHVNRLERGDG